MRDRLAHRLAQATAGATFVLILAGGLVTNTGAALAVPDWPTTFGHNMFLYPWADMVGGVFYEHSHRLLGALVGMLTVALSATLWPLGYRLRILGLVAVAAVVTQGLLGGLRVVLLSDALAIVHGSLAQAFLALVVVLVTLTAPAASTRHGQRPRVDPGLRAVTLVATALVYLQIVFGALLTHAGWISLHLAGALAVFVLVPVVSARVRRAADGATGAVARLLSALLVLQLGLGVGSYLSRFSPVWIPGGQATMLALPVAHRLVGSMLLAAMVVLAVRVIVGQRAADWRGAPRVLGPMTEVTP